MAYIYSLLSLCLLLSCFACSDKAVQTKENKELDIDEPSQNLSKLAQARRLANAQRIQGACDSCLYVLDGVWDILAQSNKKEQLNTIGIKVLCTLFHEGFSLEEQEEALGRIWQEHKDIEEIEAFRQVSKAFSFLFENQDSSKYYMEQATEKLNRDWTTFFDLAIQDLIYLSLFELNDPVYAWHWVEFAKEELYSPFELKKGEAFLSYTAGVALSLYKTSEAESALRTLIAELEKNSADEESVFGLADAYHNLASVYRQKLDYTNAERYYQEALTIGEHLFEPNDVATTYVSLAISQNDLQKNNDAIASARKAISITEEETSKPLIAADAWIALASIYFDKNKTLDSSRICLDRAALLLKQESETQKYALHNGYFDYYKKVTQGEKALEYQEKNLALLRAKPSSTKIDEAQLLSSSLSLYARLGKTEKAMAHLKRCYSLISKKDLEGESLWIPPKPEEFLIQNTAEQFNILKNSLDLAFSLVQEKQAQAPNAEEIQILIESCISLGQKLIGQKRHQKSQESFLANQWSNVLEQALFLYYELYQDSKDEKYIEAAFRISELGKAQQILKKLQLQALANSVAVPDSLLQKEERVQNELDLLEKAMLSGTRSEEDLRDLRSATLAAEKRKEQILEEIKNEYPEYFSLRSKGAQLAKIAEVQEQLKAGDIALNYAYTAATTYGSDAFYVFAIEPNALRFERVELSTKQHKGLKNLISSLNNNRDIFENTLANYNTLCQESYTVYARLVEPFIKGKELQRLVIIPDDLLCYIPFDALVQEKQELISSVEQANFGQLPYLLNSYPMSHNYSASLWVNQKRRQIEFQEASILAYAPEYPQASEEQLQRLDPRQSKLRRSLNPLYGTVKEVDALEKRYKGLFIKGKEAVEADYIKRAGPFQIMHLAMHGVADLQNPDYSALVFSEDGDSLNDNFLHAYELRSLILQSELVVLSACETGAGKYQRGEGMASLSKDFTYAGASAVLSSLWQLNDQSGVLLSSLFYKSLDTETPKDEILRQAKRTYIQSVSAIGQHPHFWSCLVFSGNEKPMSQVPEQNRSWTWLYVTFFVIFAGSLFFFFSRR